MAKTGAKRTRKEGSKYHLYRCQICLLEKYGETPTPEQIRAASYTNVWRHHEIKHPGAYFPFLRSDLYLHTAGNDDLVLPKPCKKAREKLVWPPEIRDPLMHLSEYFPPPPFHVEGNCDPLL